MTFIASAIVQMRTFQPPPAVPGSGSLPASGPLPGGDETSNAVAPLVQFFELVHIGDTIQSIVQVYFDKELVRQTSLPSRYRLSFRTNMSLDSTRRCWRLPERCHERKEAV